MHLQTHIRPTALWKLLHFRHVL